MCLRSVSVLLAVVWCAVAGCNSVSTPGGSAAGTPGGSQLATRTVSDATGTALEVVGWSLVAILPVKDLEEIVQGTIPLPSCPAFDASIAANGLAITLDYSNGCNPAQFSDPLLSGKISGSSLVTLDTFDLNFDNLIIDGVTLLGTVAGSTRKSNGITTLSMGVSVRADNAFSVSGSVKVEWNDATGDYSFAEAALTFHTDDLGSWLAEYENAAVSFAQTGTFQAVSGSAIAELVPISLSDPPQSIEVILAD